MPENLEKRIARARVFALKAHGDQKYGEHPYSYHLDHTAQILEMHGYHRARVAAYLHDVLEDTAVTFEEISKAFGLTLAIACEFCSDEPGKNRNERKQNTYKKQRAFIAQEDEPEWLAMAVRTKVADRMSNVQNSRFKRFLWDRYWREHSAFKATLFVPGMCDDMWAALDREWQGG